MTKKELEQSKNQAYKERDMLVCALSKIYPSFLTKHPKEDKTWEKDWRNIVVINIPVRRRIGVYPDFPEDMQLTWHIHKSELKLFSHLEQGLNEWDGHTTEEKYRRLECLWIEPKKKWYEFWKGANSSQD